MSRQCSSTAKFSELCRTAINNARMLREGTEVMMDWQEEEEQGRLTWLRQETQPQATQDEVMVVEEEPLTIDEQIAKDEAESRRFLAIEKIAFAAYTASEDCAALIDSSKSTTMQDHSDAGNFFVWKFARMSALMELYCHPDFVLPPANHRYSHDAAGIIEAHLTHLVNVKDSPQLLKCTPLQRQAETARAVKELLKVIDLSVKSAAAAPAQPQTDAELEDVEMTDALIVGNTRKTSSGIKRR